MLRHNSISHFKKDEINPTANIIEENCLPSAKYRSHFFFALENICDIFLILSSDSFLSFYHGFKGINNQQVRVNHKFRAKEIELLFSTSFAALIVVIYMYFGIRYALIHIFVFLMRYLLNINQHRKQPSQPSAFGKKHLEDVDAGKYIDTKYYVLTIGRLEKFSWKEDACLVGLFDHVNFRAGLPNLICYAIKHKLKLFIVCTWYLQLWVMVQTMLGTPTLTIWTNPLCFGIDCLYLTSVTKNSSHVHICYCIQY